MIKDYNIYQYSKKEQAGYFLLGAVFGAITGYVFYDSIPGMVLLTSYAFAYLRMKRKELAQKRKWQLNLEFRDGLLSLLAALNAGYSVENAFAQAVADLKLMYSSDALIVREFEGIVNQINMNCTVEDALKDLASRSDVEDIINFSEVFATAKRTGGDIIKIIRNTCNIISDKIEVKREIITLITGKKFEADIMCLVPFFIILYLRLFSGDFLKPLYHNIFGVLFMSFILILYYALFRLTRKIIHIEV
ncbi:MAG: Tight adherence protein B [Lachnoclostridium sp.]